MRHVVDGRCRLTEAGLAGEAARIPASDGGVLRRLDGARQTAFKAVGANSGTPGGVVCGTVHQAACPPATAPLQCEDIQA